MRKLSEEVERVDAAAALKTRAGAQARLDKLAETLSPEGARDLAGVLTQVVERADGLFVAVAILPQAATWSANWFANRGIFVTAVR